MLNAAVSNRMTLELRLREKTLPHANLTPSLPGNDVEGGKQNGLDRPSPVLVFIEP
jgi:hypothetical protein